MKLTGQENRFRSGAAAEGEELGTEAKCTPIGVSSPRPQLQNPPAILEVIIDGRRHAYGCESFESALALKMALIRGCVGFEADILERDGTSQSFRLAG